MNNTLRSQEKSTLVDNEGNILEISDFFMITQIKC